LIRLSVFVFVFLLAGPLRADLAAVRAEPNLEKRAGKALEHAGRAMKEADKAYSAGRLKETEAALSELRDAVLLANESLKQTGKNPSRSPKHFKRAEIKTRELLRKLDDFEPKMSVDHRGVLQEVRTSVDEVHNELLLGIMGSKRK
jgi:hypothetical protein